MSTWTARTRLARDQRRPESFVQPCLLTLADEILAGPDWQFEVKHDGWRIIARVDDGRARIWSRHGLDWTSRAKAGPNWPPLSSSCDPGTNSS
jgi:bifunctional non-homologous end joining protein LigD